MMDHHAAVAALRDLSRGLTDAADHLVGPGHDMTRRALFAAGDAAENLARVHVRAAVGADYVGDLLGTPAREVVSVDSTRPGYTIVTHEPTCSAESGFFTDLRPGQACPDCGAVCSRGFDSRAGRSVDRRCVIHDAAPCEGGCPGRRLRVGAR